MRSNLGSERLRREQAGRQAPRRRSRGQGAHPRRQRRAHGPARLHDRRQRHLRLPGEVGGRHPGLHGGGQPGGGAD